MSLGSKKTIKMKSSRRASLSIIGLSLLLIGGAVSPAANAASPASARDQETLSQIRAGLHEYGVQSSTVDLLVRKFIDGQTWDSMNGSDPVSATTKELSGALETTEVFADGSVKRFTVEKPVEVPEGEIGSRAIRDCRVTTSGSTKTYTGCWVVGGTVIITAGFSVKYQTSPGKASVLKTGQEDITILSLGAGWTDVKRKITQANATAKSPAKARLSFVATGATFAKTSWLEFRVDQKGKTSTALDF